LAFKVTKLCSYKGTSDSLVQTFAVRCII